MFVILEFLKSLRSSLGACLGAALFGGLYLLLTHRADKSFYAWTILGGIAGRGIHGLMVYHFGPSIERRRLRNELKEVASLQTAGFIKADLSEKVMNELIDNRFLGKSNRISRH